MAITLTPADVYDMGYCDAMAERQPRTEYAGDTRYHGGYQWGVDRRREGTRRALGLH